MNVNIKTRVPLWIKSENIKISAATLWGPLNPRISNSLRMFSVNIYDRTTFKNCCDFCKKPISYGRHSVRFPHIDGAWYGYFCSWVCVRKYSPGYSNISPFINAAEKELNFSGLIEA